LLYQCAKCGQLVHHQYCTVEQVTKKSWGRVHFQCSAGAAVARQAANKAARNAAGGAPKQAEEKKPASLPSWSLVEFQLPSGEGFATAHQPAKPMDAPFAVTPETPKE